MTSVGLGHIAAALAVANSTSQLRALDLGNNQIGDASGAQHLARILDTACALENLGIWNIGMDVAGAEVIASALARNTTLDRLSIGCPRISDQTQLAPLAKLVTGALSGPLNHSVTCLQLCVRRIALACETGALGEAEAQMILSNAALTVVTMSTNFLSHGLDVAFSRNTTITHLTLLRCSDDSTYLRSSVHGEMDMLIRIIRSSRTLKELDWSDLEYAPASFKRALFQSLEHNPSITCLLLDGWDSLDDVMYGDLMRSLQVNTNLERISVDKHLLADRRQGLNYSPGLEKKRRTGGLLVPSSACGTWNLQTPRAGGSFRVAQPSEERQRSGKSSSLRPRHHVVWNYWTGLALVGELAES